MQQDRRSRQRQTPWNGQDRDSAVTVARPATGPRRHSPQANRGKWRWGAATTVPVPVPVRGGALHADDGSVRSSELEEQQKATPSCLFPPRSLAPPAPSASSCIACRCRCCCAVTKLLNAARCARSGLAGCCCAAQRYAASNLPSADSENKLAPAFLPSCRCMAPSLLHRPYLLGVMIA